MDKENGATETALHHFYLAAADDSTQHSAMMQRSVRNICVFCSLLSVIAWWSSFGCSGNAHSPTLEGNFLQYQYVEMVSYSIAGSAACTTCTSADRFIGFNVEVALKDDLVHTITVFRVDQLGPFSIDTIRTPAGAILALRGTLYRENAPESEALQGYAEVRAPDEDGKAVSVVLNFPSQEPQE